MVGHSAQQHHMHVRKRADYLSASLRGLRGHSRSHGTSMTGTDAKLESPCCEEGGGGGGCGWLWVVMVVVVSMLMIPPTVRIVTNKM